MRIKILQKLPYLRCGYDENQGSLICNRLRHAETITMMKWAVWSFSLISHKKDGMR
jgi:hypothetical protein